MEAKLSLIKFQNQIIEVNEADHKNHQSLAKAVWRPI